MPVLNLDKLFYPRSVAVIGASNREASLGSVVMHNLLHGGFEGPIMPVSADRAIAGVLAYPRIDDLPLTPDLAVVCTPPFVIVGGSARFGGARHPRRHPAGAGADPARRGRPGAVVGDLRKEAERSNLRILGPNCLGVMVPGIGLNASIAHIGAQPGGVAFVSQSSTVCAAVLDWAAEHDIGFSHFISLGETADICFGDVIDYLGNDQMTRAILLYVEIDPERPQLHVRRAWRQPQQAHPGHQVRHERRRARWWCVGTIEADGADDVYDAAIRRAGMLRVYGFNELFAAVETLARAKPLRGERLGIVSNGRGMAVMAIDSLILNGGRLATLSEADRGGARPAGADRPTAGQPGQLRRRHAAGELRRHRQGAARPTRRWMR